MAYIRKIEIDSLWNSNKHVAWNLRPDVNILSGVNGVGKSTILNRTVKTLLTADRMERVTSGVTILTEPDDSLD